MYNHLHYVNEFRGREFVYRDWLRMFRYIFCYFYIQDCNVPGGTKEETAAPGDDAVARVGALRAGCAHAARGRRAHRAHSPRPAAGAYRREATILLFTYLSSFIYHFIHHCALVKLAVTARNCLF